MHNELKKLAIVSKKIKQDFWLQAKEYFEELALEKIYVVSEDTVKISDSIKSECREWSSARSFELENYKKRLVGNLKVSHPDQIDLLIKVGKKSLENSFISEIAYAEIVFLENLNLEGIKQAIEDFAFRKRNFGV